MYELSQRHPVWVAEINVTACNSVGVSIDLAKKVHQIGIFFVESIETP